MYPNDLSTCELSFAPQKTPAGLRQHINKICKFLFLGSFDPQILKVRGDDATVCWKVYDPNDDSVHTFSSESEVRIWIESRYNR